MAGLSPGDVAPFLARLARLDRDAVVRLRPAGPDAVVPPDGPAGGSPRTALWGRVPWGVLVTRTVPGPVPADTTVGAVALLRSLTEGDGSLPPSRDADWRWATPPGAGRAVEVLPAAEVRRVGTAAAETLRAFRGRVGERVLRDALLDHVPIVVTADNEQALPAGPAPVPGHVIEIRQGLVQAMLRMAFMGTNEAARVTVCIAGTWVGLAADFGTTWAQNRPSLAIQVAK